MARSAHSVPSIVEIKAYLDRRPGGAILAGLEHLDERYVKAVGYASKARRGGRPKMVLLADIVGEDDKAVGEAASAVVRIANARGAEGFIAVSTEARKQFWLDRSRTAAIAKHTNAFKINEDVVIPLDRLGDYSDGIERINIELSLKNKIRLLDALEEFFRGELPVHQEAEKLTQGELLGGRPANALELVRSTRDRWRWQLDNLDAPMSDFVAREAPLRGIPVYDQKAQAVRDEGYRTEVSPLSVFGALQNHTLRVSWKTEVREPLMRIFDGRVFDPIRAEINVIHKRVLKSRLFVALAHACGRRQRAYQYSGELRRLRDAARSQRRCRAHHETGARPERGDLRRTRHRHHQAGLSRSAGNRQLRRATSSAWILKAVSTRASCCPVPTSTMPTRRASTCSNWRA